MRSQDIPLSGPKAMAKAADYALRLNIDDFGASVGWLHRFRDRHDVVFRILFGESKDLNSTLVIQPGPFGDSTDGAESCVTHPPVPDFTE
ncbi:hypothetical protein HPB48_017750 [Haemaphysalis longicornis]|uniref:HTH CENPB-type domain-containing protein n=1 Tax=Haemaphysalis longicornis TaxID=44386 RepID=A0A9J6GNJ3_HAELO|nr:hypothetical protein HPB48_017750 [Haemaphysalis longicornis]